MHKLKGGFSYSKIVSMRCTTVSHLVSYYDHTWHVNKALESSALAEKLLNDLLKTTEGFQKLKKINECLQSQVSKDTLYYEPLKKENERVVKENNELHLKLIHLQE